MPPDEPQNLIRLFDFYLALMFLISLVRRWSVYVNALRILVAVRGRWPKLIQRLREHQSLILNWSFFRPAAIALILMVMQLIASRFSGRRRFLREPSWNANGGWRRSS